MKGRNSTVQLRKTFKGSTPPIVPAVVLIAFFIPYQDVRSEGVKFRTPTDEQNVKVAD
jgi:hypothetical protein